MSPAEQSPQALLLGAPAAEAPLYLQALQEAGYAARLFDQGPWELLREEPCHLVVVDARGAFEALAVIAQVKELCPEAAQVLLLPQGKVGLAVSAMKSGANGCLSLPVAKERLQATAASLHQTLDLQAQVRRLRQALLSRQASDAIVGQSRALQRCIGLAKLVAGYPLNVLLTGESGAGKEAMASLIHQSSGRGVGPFIAVDCGALGEELADDELFGHKKGAYTGADSDRLGRMQEANGGTLFLDEIGNLPMNQQAKLLRVLQARELWPLGSAVPVSVDLRIVAATNEDLPSLIEQGRFRLDLYHRLNEFSLRVPALRERPEDIEPLAQYFVKELCRRFGREPLGLDPEAVAKLRTFAWPGNVRQLQNAIKQACVLAKGVIRLSDLPAEIATATAAVPVPVVEAGEDGLRFSAPEGLLTLWQAEKRVTEEVERRMISEALVLHRGDKHAAAEALGIHAKTFARKMREHELMGFVGW